MSAGMRKILDGVLKFRQTIRKDLVKQFEKVRDNPNPTAVFFTCMDSRILPERFVQAQVGDMFVVRNSANMIPSAAHYGSSGYEVSVTTEPAALELAVKRGNVRHVIVCGHSDCKAINALYNLHKSPGLFDPKSPMDHWLRKYGYWSVKKLERHLQEGSKAELLFEAENQLFSFSAFIDPNNKFGVEDKLSQINTLQQLTNVASHGFLEKYMKRGSIRLHAMWFDVYAGEMYLFSHNSRCFVLLDEESVPKLLGEVEEQSEH